MMRRRSAIATGLVFLCFEASAPNKADMSFNHPLIEAKRLNDTDPGKAYDNEPSKIVSRARAICHRMHQGSLAVPQEAFELRQTLYWIALGQNLNRNSQAPGA